MQLKHLHHLKVLSDDQFSLLASAYQYYHVALHRHLLQLEVVSGEEHQQNVLMISRLFFTG
jgi:hypothetical protein